jgi:hypothetical protein
MKALIKYKNKLRELIENSSSGILIDARHKVDSAGTITNSPRAAFRLPRPSCRLQRQYIMIAALFRSREWFDECVNRFADLARNVNQNKQPSFSALASCTATAKHLMDHLQARLSATSAVRACYHGLYPLDPGGKPLF